MTLSLEHHSELLEELGSHASEILQSSWYEAARVFSAQGLENYVQGARSLKSLGRGNELVITFIESAPSIAKEIGEDSVVDLLDTVMALASKTSGAVLQAIIASAPTAAKRLGDASLFGAYLQLVNTLLNQVPRGLRPMMENLETLLGQLTLGGLRRWATWGAHAHKTNFEEQISYFSLKSKESLAMLQKERKGTLFIDVQRRINMYLRALWARDFFMRPTSGDFESREGYKPFIEDYFLHLPDAFDDYEGVPGLELYRATAAHCAAHLVYTTVPISAETLNPLQMAVISVIEDARVETLSIRAFPGLKKVWARLHKVQADQANTAGDYLNRLARALLDSDFKDDDPWIAQGRALFTQAADRLTDNTISWEIGVALAHGLLEKRIGFNPRTDVLTAPYRDDNRYFWEFEEFDFNKSQSAGFETVKQVRRHVSVTEFANEIDCETAGDDAQEIWIMSEEFFPYEDNGVSYNESEGKEPMSEPFHYSEWDYQIQLERPAWATVMEKRSKAGDLQVIDQITADNKQIASRLKFLLDAMQPQGVQRIRKLEDGDEIDINAAISSMIDFRMGIQPDPRIMMRSVRKVRDISVLVLLDLSESTNEKVLGQDQSVLDLTRQACVLLSDAINKIGDPFAIHGFCSDGRHDVEYYRFKDFEQPYNELPKSRLAGMTGQLSTRMGAAIRHATHYLNNQRTSKKLLMVITDGEPADVDVRDPQYLRYDAKKSVEDAARKGISTFCMTLDPRADQYVSRIFGAKNYMIVDQIARLPEKLPLLYAGLTR
ncbi:MAG: Rubisco activation protein CbbO [Candidatus Gallionella acididurans]|uniref:Rubisco activation protein CbbO n=1 Tax=Candidatus Gallionella acididurans TaxID=1796491 RepID=A0A139BT33_9PROT|nr:MAG: Rubisco activation protein CbbO [Candidatus Gallionella acididurans]